MSLLERGEGNHPSFPKLSLKGKSSEKLNKLSSLKGKKTKRGKNRHLWILYELCFAPTKTYLKREKVLPSEPCSEQICFLNISQQDYGSTEL